MNAGELRAALDGVPDGVLVVMAKDAEGNGYSPLAGVDTAETTLYEADSTWSGEVLDTTDPDIEAHDYPDAVRAVVLEPVN